MAQSLDDFHFIVSEFFEEYKFIAQYVKQLDSVYDPATGTMTSSKLEVPVEAILLDLTLNSNGLSTRFGTLVIDGDKQLLVRPPEYLKIDTATDRVMVHGIQYKLVTFKEYNPTGDQPILYDLYIRR